jgi:hypothetical protein
VQGFVTARGVGHRRLASRRRRLASGIGASASRRRRLVSRRRRRDSPGDDELSVECLDLREARGDVEALGARSRLGRQRAPT